MEERRKSIRIRRPLLLRFIDKSNKTQLICISNVNQEGISFLSSVLFKEGEYIDASLKLPSQPNEWHECRLKILESKDITKYPGAFVSGFKTRVKFDSISERTITFLKDYCDFAVKQNQALERIFQERLGVLEKNEKIESIRINKSIVAMYGTSNQTAPADWDITAIRNISIGDAVFTTKQEYKKFIHLQLLLKIPLKPFDWINFTGKVVESSRLKNVSDVLVGGMYLTRIEFTIVPMENRELLEEYVEWFVKNLKKSENI